MTKENRNQTREIQVKLASASGRHCPFVANPFNVCFIANINSQNIDQAIYYCGNNFEECEIYGIYNKTGT